MAIRSIFYSKKQAELVCGIYSLTLQILLIKIRHMGIHISYMAVFYSIDFLFS